MIEPAGVAVDDFGRIYLSDASLHRISRFDPKASGWARPARSVAVPGGSGGPDRSHYSGRSMSPYSIVRTAGFKATISSDACREP